MKIPKLVVSVLVLTLVQTLVLTGRGWGQAAAGGAGLTGRLQAALGRLESALQAAEPAKWHTDRHARESFQSEADSLARNLSEAVPNLLRAYSQAPEDLVAGLRLYRDLDAVEQAATQATQMAAAYGPREPAEALAGALDALSQSVSDLAAALEAQAGRTEARLRELEKREQTATTAATLSPSPKAIVIDANSDANRGAAPTRAHRSKSRKKKATPHPAVPPA